MVVPLLVLELPIVGFCEVLQTTPLAVTVAPPSAVTFPPDTAEVVSREEIAVDWTVGNTTAFGIEIVTAV